MENYANYPMSLTEVKSKKPEGRYDPRKWTPRDVLIDLLRDIDNGECDPDTLMVVYREKDEDADTPKLPQTLYSGASHSLMIGIVDLAMHRFRSRILGHQD